MIRATFTKIATDMHHGKNAIHYGYSWPSSLRSWLCLRGYDPAEGSHFVELLLMGHLKGHDGLMRALNCFYLKHLHEPSWSPHEALMKPSWRPRETLVKPLWSAWALHQLMPVCTKSTYNFRHVQNNRWFSCIQLLIGWELQGFMRATKCPYMGFSSATQGLKDVGSS